MRAIFPRLLLIAGASGLLLQVGCGGCDDDDVTFDAPPQIDSAPPIDAEPPIDTAPAATRSGQIAVTEVRILTAGGAAVGMSGPAVSIEFQDLTTFDPASIAFDSRTPLGEGCLVQVFDLAATPNPIEPAAVVDEGPVTVTGTELTINQPCAFNETAGRYMCVQAGGSAEGAVVAPGVPSATTTMVTFTASPGTNLVATYARITGLTEGANATVFANAFPVMATPTANSVVLATGAATAAITAETAAAGATFVMLAAEAPVPNGAAIADFLDDATADVTVDHAAGTNVEAFTTTMRANGEGIDLDDDSDDPTNITLDGSAVTFSCGGANGSCGAVSDAALKILAVSGKTTDTAPVTGDPDFLMRPPTTKWATWSCAALDGTELTIPAEAMTAIMGTDPERVEFRIFRMSADIQVNDNPPPNRTNVVIGHGVVGHTTPPAAAKAPVKK